MPRLFVGIPVPGECRDVLDEMARALAMGAGGALRKTRPENFHLTLQSLGDTPYDRVQAVAEALASVEFNTFRLRPGPVGCLPDCRCPRVLYVGAEEGEAACVDLANKVRDAMDAFGYERGRRFLPHLTLGRIKKPGEMDWAGLVAGCIKRSSAFAVDRLVLWQSELPPDGPIYSRLREYPAAGVLLR
ncbi:RNA 2',3'-cyclic phosphodiesterase [Pseudodesulfovibrio sp.]|uniref:RNA 2',3'-cyclic phosphodiesterase n=1 Tax=unclassified Pseudodesulfovibrio TaxID=2661612 RepID=UPI003AFFD2D8